MRAVVIALLGTAVLYGPPAPASTQATGGEAPGSWVSAEVRGGAGTRTYKLWIPGGTTGARALPLVMMLHGCSQDPDDFAAGTRMNELADQREFFVVYPDQPRAANAAKCWNWFDPRHQRRGSGEPAVLADVVRAVSKQVAVDARRVYVAGLSAGGAMAVVMGATYPDVFAAVGVAAGLEYGAGRDVASALNAQRSGGPDPDGQGRAALAAMGAFKRRVPVIVFHGTADTTVAPINARQTLAQWAQTNDLADDGADDESVSVSTLETEAGQVPGGRGFNRAALRDASGRILLEEWLVRDMPHAWSGGSDDGSYTDPLGPDATREMWRFFEQWTRDG